MSTESPANRAVINEKTEESRVPLLGWRQTDALFVVVVALVAFFAVGTRIGEGVLSFGVAGIGFLIGYLIIYAKPNGYNIVEASVIGFEYILQPKIMFAASEDADSDAKNKGGLLNKSPLKQLKPAERTQDLTNIKRAFPHEDAILSKDGRMERIIKIDGENMDFADPGIWADRQSSGQRFADDNIEDRVKLYVTTRDFDFDSIVDRLESRLEDKDIKQAPVAEAVLKQYREERPAELRSRGTQHVKAYLVLSIAKDNVSTGYADEQTPEEKLANIPILSRIVKRFVDVDNEEEEESRTTNEVMIDKLNQLTKKVQEGLIDQTEGYSARRLTTVEMVVLLANIHNDREVNPERARAAVGEAQEEVGNEHDLDSVETIADERRAST
jgi:hypothetical protein